MEASTGSVFCKEAWCSGTFPARASVATAGLQLTDCSLTLQGGARGRRPGAAGRCPASLHTPCTSMGASTFVPWKSLTMRYGRTGQASRTPQTSTRNIFATSSGWHSQSLFRYLQVKLCTVFQVRRTRPRLCAPRPGKGDLGYPVSRMLAWKYVYIFTHKSACNFELRHCALQSELGIFAACLNCTFYQSLLTNITYRPCI